MYVLRTSLECVSACAGCWWIILCWLLAFTISNMIYLRWYKMWRFVFVLGLALPLCLSWADQVNADADVIEVDIESGRIRGKRSLTLFQEKPYYSFRGIPYAQPPIKDLRFKVSWMSGSDNVCTRVNVVVLYMFFFLLLLSVVCGLSCAYTPTHICWYIWCVYLVFCMCQIMWHKFVWHFIYMIFYFGIHQWTNSIHLLL